MRPMGVTIREWKGAWWIFINDHGTRKAKRIGTGAVGKKAAKQAAEQIQARLALGQTPFDQPPDPRRARALHGPYENRSADALSCIPLCSPYRITARQAPGPSVGGCQFRRAFLSRLQKNSV